MQSPSLGEPWVILSRRYGGDTSNPSPQDLNAAIEELYVEDLAGMTEADYAEHGKRLDHGSHRA